ncbi:endolytic transglycosylase MltG [Pseudoroseomonas wenyumeiae]|uniref:Endolytic murein transglycosylase n=1 Tax=Teichococcus wenyumeiae TaxID=2478470 RepID=A0A3A9K180_9PROT|nr:endolytic transglycosylase MltG [Pseudoroseomonas wenyumeiae]RKK05099.1 endolytic transglycosylase MltG [Pseudoroseomonas wenyumeiae]RMI20925.1 endolytic transglycosylase MltG [Pseudoroseomonas wenyumeiae]
MRKALIVFLVLVLLAAGGAWWAREQYVAPGPLAEPTAIVVPRGSSQAIAEVLVARGAIRDPRIFTLAARLTRAEGPLRAGEYLFPAQGSLQQVLEVLREARPVQRRLTLPEGLTAKQIIALIDAAPGLTGNTPALDEGTVLPETYSYQYGDTRAALVRRATTAMSATLERLWKERSPGLPLDTPREALVLASIVERETGMPEERPRVAAVFLNRLKRGMPLQSDPTVAYAAADGAPLDRPLTRADLDREHPFNTYRVRGLPPGPIASPGEKSLEAVLHPAESDDIYFVADGSGGHAFARTLEEHNRNVARWRQIERQRAAPR